MTNEPLGLPRGSVRAVLAILVTAGFLASVLLEVQNGTEVLAGMTGAVITYYFVSRTASNRTEENVHEKG